MRNPQTSAQLFGMEPGPHSVGGSRCRKQTTVHKCFVNCAEVVFAAIPPCVTCNKVNFLINHDGSKSEDELLDNALLFGINVADM